MPEKCLKYRLPGDLPSTENVFLGDDVAHGNPVFLFA